MSAPMTPRESEQAGDILRAWRRITTAVDVTGGFLSPSSVAARVEELARRTAPAEHAAPDREALTIAAAVLDEDNTIELVARRYHRVVDPMVPSLVEKDQTTQEAYRDEARLALLVALRPSPPAPEVAPAAEGAGGDVLTPSGPGCAACGMGGLVCSAHPDVPPAGTTSRPDACACGADIARCPRGCAVLVGPREMEQLNAILRPPAVEDVIRHLGERSGQPDLSRAAVELLVELGYLITAATGRQPAPEVAPHEDGAPGSPGPDLLCPTCGHTREYHHKLRCEHPECTYCNGWADRWGPAR